MVQSVTSVFCGDENKAGLAILQYSLVTISAGEGWGGGFFWGTFFGIVVQV